MAKPIYLGNSAKKEFHSIARQTPQCNVDEIKSPVYFKRGKDARAADYDACAYCVKHWKSRDNK